MKRIGKAFLLGSQVVVLVAAVLAGLSLWIAYARERDLREASERIVDLERQLELQDRKLGAIRDGFSTLDREVATLGQSVEATRRLGEEARAHLLAEVLRQREVEDGRFEEVVHAIERRVGEIEVAAERNARELERARSDVDAKTRYRELVAPTVRIDARSEVGSGTVIWAGTPPGDRKASAFVVTVFHIVREDVRDAQGIVSMDIYEAGRVVAAKRGRVVCWDEDLDLALIQIEAPGEAVVVARIASAEVLATVGIFSKACAVGCPLGYPPMPTSGEFTSLDKTLDGRSYWMVNAPTIFGNSGGGVYLAETRVLVGILSRISAYKNLIDVAVPHMGIVTPLDRVYRWLDKAGYGFIVPSSGAALEAGAPRHGGGQTVPPPGGR